MSMNTKEWFLPLKNNLDTTIINEVQWLSVEQMITIFLSVFTTL